MSSINEALATKFADGETWGLGRNMFIEEDTIYSYGKHYKIAVRLNSNQKFATNVSHVFNSESNSSATNKQRSYVRSNLQAYIEIPECNIEETYLRSYVNGLKIEVESVRAKQSKLKTKGKRFYQIESKIAAMTDRVKEVDNFTVALYGGQAIQFIKEEE